MNVTALLTLLDQIRIYHWQTPKHREHVAFNDLYEGLSDKIDEIIEVFQGKHGIIKAKVSFDMKAVNYSSSENCVSYLDKFIEYFNSDFIDDPENNGDLVSIKDDIVALLNKTKYLLSFNG